MEPKIDTIPTAFTHLITIYRKANAITTPRDERFLFLGLACADLSRCYRKKQDWLYAITIAQVFSWCSSLADEFFRDSAGETLATAMSEKYPANGCGYCGKLRCECPQESRPENTLTARSSTQCSWSLREWQEHLDKVYGDTNRSAGADRVINRLFEEVAEVGRIFLHVDGTRDSLEQRYKNTAHEMADVLAWLIAVCVVLQIDLQAAVRKVYDNGCPVCVKHECECGSFEREPAGKFTHRFMSAEAIEYFLTFPPQPLTLRAS